eukprot:1060720-Rhodomonas_salina.3
MSEAGAERGWGGQDCNASSFGVPVYLYRTQAKRDAECRNSSSYTTQALWRCVYICKNAIQVQVQVQLNLGKGEASLRALGSSRAPATLDRPCKGTVRCQSPRGLAEEQVRPRQQGVPTVRVPRLVRQSRSGLAHDGRGREACSAGRVGRTGRADAQLRGPGPRVQGLLCQAGRWQPPSVRAVAQPAQSLKRSSA